MSFSSGFATGMRFREQKRKQDEEDAMKAEFKTIAGAAPEQFNVQPLTSNDDDGNVNAPASGMRFMGKTYQEAPTDAEMGAARNMAMAGVIKKYDPVRGMEMEQRMQGADREAQRFGQDKKDWAQKDKDRAIEDEFKSGREALQQNSPLAQSESAYQSAMAKHQEDVKTFEGAGATPGGAPGMVARGPAPVAPTRQSPTTGQMLQFYASLVGHDAKYGKISTAEIMNLGAKLDAQKKEGYVGALKKLAAGASLQDVAKAFNSTGEQKFDPKNVLSDKMVIGPDGVPSRVVTFRQDDGGIGTINAVQELDAVDQANKVFDRFFDSQTNNRAIAAARRVATHDKLNVNSKREAMLAGMALYKETNPNATPAQLEAVRTGVLAATPKAAAAGGYKTEAGDITSLLGVPALNRDGTPLIEPLTGKQAVNRDVAREKALLKFMDEKGIKDTNEGLQRFLVSEGAADAPAKNTPKVGDRRPIIGGAGKGKTAVYDGTGWTQMP